MKSLKSAARRGAVISAAALSALALASCSGGQVTQTSSKVMAVDGNHAATADHAVAVEDVTILVEPGTNAAALKFTAFNQGYKNGEVTLKSVTVDGKPVTLGAVKPLGRDQSIVANSQKNLDANPQVKDDSIQYVATTLANDNFGYAGSRKVVFEFSNGPIEVDAAIAASPLQSGEYNRDVKSVEGFTTEAPEAGHGEHAGHDHAGHKH